MLAYGELILKVNTLECVVKVQQKQLDAFRSGERYLKLQKDFRRVIAGYERTIRNLKTELGKAHAETVKVRNIWFEQCAQRDVKNAVTGREISKSVLGNIKSL